MPVGGLLGKKNSVLQSFDIVVDDNGIDLEYLNSKLAHFKIIYPSLDFIGFFQASQFLTPDPLAIALISSLQLPSQPSLIYMMVDLQNPLVPIRVCALSDLKTPILHDIEIAASERASLTSIHKSTTSKQSPIAPSEKYRQHAELVKKNLQILQDKIDRILTFVQTSDPDQDTLMEIDRLLFEFDSIKENQALKKSLDNQRLEALVAVTTNLLVLMK